MLKRLSQNPYFLLAPTVVLLLIFSYYPFLSALGYAFFRWPYLTRAPEWAGLSNFAQLFRDGDLWLSFRNMLWFLVSDVLKVIIVTTIVAELIFSLRSPKLAQFYRVALVLPMVVPGIVGLYIWASFYDYQTGLVNTMMRPLERSRLHHSLMDTTPYQWLRGVDEETAALIDEERAQRHQLVAQLRTSAHDAESRRLVSRVASRAIFSSTDQAALPADVRASVVAVNVLDEQLLAKRNITLDKSWLGDEDTALGSFVFMGFPWCGGIAVLIVLAGLYGIPQDIFDCARIDGVGPIRRILTIDIYLIAGQLKLLIVMAMLGSIQGFMGQMILTDGGPGNSTLVPGLHLIHHAFKYRDLGYGAAIAVLLFAIMLLLTFINMKYIRSSEAV